MKNNEKRVISAIDEMIKAAPEIGIMPFVFELLKDEVVKIINEKNELEAELEGLKK